MTEQRREIPIELIQKSREKDPRAMESLYEYYKSSFFGLAFRYTANSAVAEDLVQDIFIKIFTHLQKLDNNEAFVGWAYRIAVNTCLSYLRRKKVHLSKTVPLDDVEMYLSQGGDHSHRDFAIRGPLEEAIRGLSPKLKSVLMLHDIKGFKHEEIAGIMGCSSGTSKSQLFKARMKIRKYLKTKGIF